MVFDVIAELSAEKKIQFIGYNSRLKEYSFALKDNRLVNMDTSLFMHEGKIIVLDYLGIMGDYTNNNCGIDHIIVPYNTEEELEAYPEEYWSSMNRSCDLRLEYFKSDHEMDDYCLTIPEEYLDEFLCFLGIKLEDIQVTDYVINQLQKELQFVDKIQQTKDD